MTKININMSYKLIPNYITWIINCNLIYEKAFYKKNKK